MPVHVTIGGIDLAVSAYSQHPQLAFQAALCLRDRAEPAAQRDGRRRPPTLISLYSDPKLFPTTRSTPTSCKALETASVRPKTPAYQIVSIDISHLVSPPAGINPTSTEKSDGQPAQQRPAVEGPDPVNPALVKLSAAGSSPAVREGRGR